MPKTSPFEGWNNHVMERVTAFKQSPDLRRLRRKGLSILGTSRRLTDEQFIREFWGGRVETEEYTAFQDDCRQTGLRYRLASWTVEWTCILRNYHPERAQYVVEARWPKMTVVTEAQDELFLAWLVYVKGGEKLYQQGGEKLYH